MSRCGGMVDTADSKSAGRKTVGVRVSPSALQAFVVELVDTTALEAVASNGVGVRVSPKA